MVGAYYTANGPSSEINKMAKFKAVTYKPATGTEGVDWISRSVTVVTGTQPQPDGSTIDITDSAPAYFVIEGSSSALEPTEEIVGSWIIEDGIAKPQGNISIDVELYPSNFENPYNNKTLGESFKDGLVYEFSDSGISHTAKYYYYEGGYMTDRDINNLSSPAKYIYDILDNSTQSDLDSMPIYIYDDQGDEVKTDGSGNFGSTYTEIITWKEFKDNYNKLKDVYYTEITTLDECKVGNTYKYDGRGNWYKRRSNYLIGDGTNGEAGKLCIRLIDMFANSEEKENVFNYKKLEDNAKWGVYTNNKYTDENGLRIFLSGKKEKDRIVTPWKYKNGDVEDYFYLVPNISNYNENYSGTPNGEYATYLTESVKTTIGGGLLLNHTGVGSNIQAGVVFIIKN